MTPNRHGTAVIEFPNDLEIVTTREFDAPIELDSFNKMEDYLRLLLDQKETVSG